MSNHFTICRWDLNSIFAHSFAKVQLLEAYLSAQKFDIVCFSETYLNSSCPFHDENLDIHGYIKVRVDHLANSKREGVCMYNKSCPDVHDVRFLQGSIAFQLRISDKLCSFISLYRSPNQSYDDFVSFLDNFELTLDNLAQQNLLLMVAIGDLYKMVYIKKLMNKHIF